MCRRQRPVLTRRQFVLASAAATGAVAARASGLLQPLAAAALTAPEVVSLGSPLRDVLLIGGTVAPGPDGRPVLWSASSGDPAKLNAVDPSNGHTLDSQALSGSPGSYAVAATPDGTIYVGAYSTGFLYRRRPGSGTPLENLGRPLSTESYIWRLAVDDEGRVFGGTYPGGRVFGYDPSTGEVRDYGQLVPGIRYVRSIAVWGSHIYAGTQPDAHVVQIHKDTGERRELPVPQQLDGTGGVTVYDLNAYAGRVYARFGSALSGKLGIYDISTGQWSDLIDGVAGLDVSPPGPDGDVYFTRHNELTRHNPRTGSTSSVGHYFPGRVVNNRGIGWAALGDPAWPGRTLVGLLWRGEMFRYNPITGRTEVLQTNIPGEPVPLATLHAGGSGVLYAGGYLSGGIAQIQPSTGQSSFHRFAQTESILESDGAVWLGAYPSSRLYRYDPTLPWSSPEYDPGPPGADDNPQKLVDLSDQHQVRARAMTDAGAEIVYGTMPDGTNLDGALVVIDKATGSRKVHRPVVTDQSIVSLCYADGLVVGGSSIHGGYSVPEPTQTQAKLFGWDLGAGSKAFEFAPLEGVTAIPALAVDARQLVWGLADGQLFGLDVAGRQVVHRLRLNPDTGTTTGQLAYHAGADALYALVQGHLLFRVDASTKEKSLVLDRPARYLAVHPDGQVFLGEGTEVFRVTLS
jgi:hypothetical protein